MIKEIMARFIRINRFKKAEWLCESCGKELLPDDARRAVTKYYENGEEEGIVLCMGCFYAKGYHDGF